MYVIKKGLWYVSQPGRGSSYTKYLQYARVFKTKEEAERNRCPENEEVVPIYDEIGTQE